VGQRAPADDCADANRAGDGSPASRKLKPKISSCVAVCQT
jgi:hypothetical protein